MLPIHFSIIIPTYNRANKIKTVLATLINQTYKNFEIIICDDGSTDNTQNIVNNFIEKLDINYICFENSGGPAYPRNRGIQAAKYDWICFLDSDDLWTDNKLEVLAKNIIQNKSFIYCHPVFLVNEANQKLSIIGNYHKGLFLNDFESLLYNGNQVVNSSLCVKKSILTSQYYYNIDHNFQFIEDYLFILNLTHGGYKIKCISENLGYYSIHKDNRSSNLSMLINQCKLYFSYKSFTNINYQKVESLLLYMGTNSESFSNLDKVKTYFKLIFKRQSSFEIKIKSLYKLFLQLICQLFQRDKLYKTITKCVVL